MAHWNELFHNENYHWSVPETELFNWLNLLERTFPERPLRIWDLGCGAGRHTLAITRCGHKTYASDNAPKAIELTKELLNNAGVESDVRLADMTEFPWDKNIKLHGVLSWNVLHHNTLNNIIHTVELIQTKLTSGGILLATLNSNKADSYGKGLEIEPDTFVKNTGDEAGVAHYYFDEKGINKLFSKDKWEHVGLFEQVVRYIKYPEQLWGLAPLPYTKWVVIMKKR
jgi:SAM-dependent methyltransferase